MSFHKFYFTAIFSGKHEKQNRIWMDLKNFSLLDERNSVDRLTLNTKEVNENALRMEGRSKGKVFSDPQIR